MAYFNACSHVKIMYLNDSSNCKAYLFKENAYGISALVLSTIAVICLIVNVYVALLAFKIRRTFTATLKLVISLAMADSWTSLAMVIGFLLNSYFPFVWQIVPPQSGAVGLILEMFRSGGMFTSIFHLLVLSTNHYINIAFPFSYATLLSPKKTNVILILLWVFPPLMFLILFCSIPDQFFRSKYLDNRMAYAFLMSLEYRLLSVLPIAASFLVMIFIYIAIYVMLAKLESNMTSGSTNTALLSTGNGMANRNQRRTQLSKKRSTMNTAILILATFAAGWLPSITQFLSMCKGCPLGKQKLSPEMLFGFSLFGQLMILLKTLINPIVYAIRIPEIRDVCGNTDIFNRLCRSNPTQQIESTAVPLTQRVKADPRSKISDGTNIVAEKKRNTFTRRATML